MWQASKFLNYKHTANSINQLHPKKTDLQFFHCIYSEIFDATNCIHHTLLKTQNGVRYNQLNLQIFLLKQTIPLIGADLHKTNFWFRFRVASYFNNNCSIHKSLVLANTFCGTIYCIIYDVWVSYWLTTANISVWCKTEYVPYPNGSLLLLYYTLLLCPLTGFC